MSILSAGKQLIKDIFEVTNKVEERRALTFIDILWCGIRYGASPNNYFNFDFRHTIADQRKTFLTHRKNEFLMRKYNKKDCIWQLENKYEFARIIGTAYGRFFCRTDNITEEELIEIAKSNRFIYKPLCGGQGIGIQVFDAYDCENTYNYLNYLHTLPIGILEQWIEQDESISALYPDAINPIRVQSLFTDSVHFIAATITIANGTSIANASGVKAIFGLVNIKNGIVYSDGFDYGGKKYISHPLTGVKIKGFKIPQWNKVLILIRETAKKFPSIRHIGWDIAITKSGPIIIEANNDPGYTAYQLPQLTGKHIGIWPLYKKYMKKNQ